jgi:hypothetical protein
MKEIEKLAEIAFQDELIKSNQNINWVGYGKGIDGTSKERWIELWIKGYTQCQKDIFNELNEWIVVTLSAESKLGSPNSVIETLLSVKYKIESLNKQD